RGTWRSDEHVVRTDTATEYDQNEGSDHLRQEYFLEHESECLSVLLRILDRQHGTHVALTRANRCSFGIRCRSSGFRFCFAPLGVSLTFAGLAVLVPPEEGRDEAENLIKCGISAVGDLIVEAGPMQKDVLYMQNHLVARRVHDLGAQVHGGVL